MEIGTLAERIRKFDPEAADEVSKLIEIANGKLTAENRYMSVALQSVELTRFREEVRKQFQGLRRDPRVDALEEKVVKLRESLVNASTTFQDMKNRLHALESSSPNRPPAVQPPSSP